MLLLPAIPFLIIIGAFVTLGLALTAKQNSNAFADFFNGLTPLARLILVTPVRLSLSLARYITHHLGVNWKALEGVAVSWVGGLTQWAAKPVTFAIQWPFYLQRFQAQLLYDYLPRLWRTIPHAVTKVIRPVTTRVTHVERTIVKLPKLSKALAKALVAGAVATYVHPFLSDLLWIRRHFHALTAVIPRALPIPTVPAIPNLRKRLGRLERIIGAGIGIAAVARALARLNVGWIRCNKVGRLGRAACGLDEGLLESLLTDALAIFGVVSVVEFANGLRAVEDEALAIMGKLVREWPTA